MGDAARKILVIDDEPDVSRAVRLTITLQEPDWHVLEANDPEQGLLMVDSESPDLVLLDLVMPHMSGFDVLKQIRLFSDVPVIVLTVRDDELDKVRGLELGADDYIVKPFGHLELMARIRSVLRRAEGTASPLREPFQTGDLRVDFNRHIVTVKGKEVRLTSTEYKILEVLVHHAGKIVSPGVLIAKTWGLNADEGSEYLKVYIHRIRSKIEEDPSNPKYLHTVRGEGYWFGPPSEHQT